MKKPEVYRGGELEEPLRSDAVTIEDQEGPSGAVGVAGEAEGGDGKAGRNRQDGEALPQRVAAVGDGVGVGGVEVVPEPSAG